MLLCIFQMSTYLVSETQWRKRSWTLWPHRKVVSSMSSFWKTSRHLEKCLTASLVSSSIHSTSNPKITKLTTFFGVSFKVKIVLYFSLSESYVLKYSVTMAVVIFHTTGDSTVTMCGIAQEDISKKHEDDPEKAFTTPWHVTLKSVRTLPLKA